MTAETTQQPEANSQTATTTGAATMPDKPASTFINTAFAPHEIRKLNALKRALGVRYSGEIVRRAVLEMHARTFTSDGARREA